MRGRSPDPSIACQTPGIQDVRVHRARLGHRECGCPTAPHDKATWHACPCPKREDDLGRQAEWGAADQTPAGCLVEVRRARTTVLAHIEDRPEVESVRRIDGML